MKLYINKRELFRSELRNRVDNIIYAASHVNISIGASGRYTSRRMLINIRGANIDMVVITTIR